MKYAVIAATLAAGLAVASPALAKGGGPEGGPYWLHKNQNYSKAHPVVAMYACKAGNALVVRAAPCARDTAIASAK